eukprot:gene22570-biopygen7216
MRRRRRRTGGKGGKIENAAPQAPHGVQRRKIENGGTAGAKLPLALNAPTADTHSKSTAPRMTRGCHGRLQ